MHRNRSPDHGLKLGVTRSTELHGKGTCAVWAVRFIDVASDSEIGI